MLFESSLILLCGLFAISTVWTRSPFMSLMFAVGLFVNASVVLLILGFEFLALVNMLVYVGALAVLFLFVIMLLEIPSTELRAYHRGWSTLALFGALASTSVGLPVLTGSSAGSNMQYSVISPTLPICDFLPTAESISSIGYAFYVRYADLLILNSLVLTVALFGALVLANTSYGGLKGN
jgi:NADH:ubiquinone oxidoreductase subunit 6 (subunit J)